MGVLMPTLRRRLFQLIPVFTLLLTAVAPSFAQDAEATGSITYLSGSDFDQLGSLYSLDVATGEITRITQGVIQTYDWSPDGEKLALGDGHSIFVTDADGSNLQVIAAGSHIVTQEHYVSPVWSPDGSRIAFVEYDNGGYVKIADLSDPDDSHMVTIKAARMDPPLFWSPDGNSLAAFATTGEPDLSFTLVTGLNDCRPPDTDCSYPEFTISGLMYGWLPDGRILITGTPCCGLSLRSIDLAVPGCADSGQRDCALTGSSVQSVYDTPSNGEIIHEMMPDWSADGASLLFLSNHDGRIPIYRMDTITGAAHQLTDYEFFRAAAIWSPDAKYIAFTEVDTDHHMDNIIREWLMLMNADGSQVRLLATFDAYVWDIQWRPK